MSTVKRTTVTQQRRRKSKNNNAPVSTTVTTTVLPKSNQRRKPKARKGILVGNGLSDCSLDYARALVNPFSGPLACVPSFPAFMTRRSKVWVKGTFTTSNTNSLGYILCEPTNLVANDIDAVAASTAASTVTTASNTAALDPSIALFRTNSEYTSAQFGATAGLIQYRPVAVGIRIRYIGTNLNQGGFLIGCHEPDHGSLVGSGIADFDAQLESRRMPVSRNWSNVVYKPISTTDVTFRANFAGTGTNLGWYMGFIVQSAVAAQTFEFEVHAIHEMEGRTLRGKSTSHADPVGFSAVNTVAATTPVMYPSQASDPERESSIVDQAARYLNEAMSGPTTAKVAAAAGVAAGQYVNYYNQHRHSGYDLMG